MKTVKLKDLVDFSNGYAFKSTDYVEYSNTVNCRMSNIRPDGSFDVEYNIKYLPDEFAEKYKGFILNDGDIIIAMTDMAGDPKILGVPTLVNTKGYSVLMNQRVGKLTLKSKDIHPTYLKYYLMSNYARNYFKSFAGGGVQLNIGQKEILNIDIKLCDIKEQVEICNVLDKINVLIQQNSKQIEKLDQLVKSRFIEMFGGVDYQTVLFENVCVFLRNGASIKQTKGAGGYPITRIETLSNDVFNIDRLGYADITDLEKYQSYVLHNGDILISHINSVAYLGRAVQYRGQLDTPIIHGMNLLCARIVDSYNPAYIEWFFKTPMAKEYISTITKKAVNQASITTSDLKKMQVPNPPKNLQDQFAAFVEQTDKLKLEVKKSLEKLETLKKSLMQQYFG